MKLINSGGEAAEAAPSVFSRWLWQVTQNAGNLPGMRFYPQLGSITGTSPITYGNVPSGSGGSGTFTIFKNVLGGVITTLANLAGFTRILASAVAGPMALVAGSGNGLNFRLSWKMCLTTAGDNEHGTGFVMKFDTQTNSGAPAGSALVPQNTFGIVKNPGGGWDFAARRNGGGETDVVQLSTPGLDTDITAFALEILAPTDTDPAVLRVYAGGELQHEQPWDGTVLPDFTTDGLTGDLGWMWDILNVSDTPAPGPLFFADIAVTITPAE